MPIIRELPAQETRVESGAIRFGDDWPGLFLRGDQAAFLGHRLTWIIDRLERLDPNMYPSEAGNLAYLKAIVDHIEKDVIVKSPRG